MQPIGKKLVTAMDWQQEPIGKKLVLDFFVKIIYATPLVYLFLQLFFIFIINRQPRNRLALINQSYFN